MTESDNKKISFGTLVRQSRKNQGLTLKTLANAIEVSQAYWSRIERSLENPPSDTLIDRVAKVLSIELDTAFSSAGRLPPDLRAELGEIVRFWRGLSS